MVLWEVLRVIWSVHGIHFLSLNISGSTFYVRLCWRPALSRGAGARRCPDGAGRGRPVLLAPGHRRAVGRSLLRRGNRLLGGLRGIVKRVRTPSESRPGPGPRVPISSGKSRSDGGRGCWAPGCAHRGWPSPTPVPRSRHRSQAETRVQALSLTRGCREVGWRQGTAGSYLGLVAATD